MKIVMMLCLALLFHPGLYAADSRIKTVIYHPDQVYEITTAYGVATTISFAEDEEVLGVSLGDPSVWQIVPIGHTLNIKPIGLSPDTNLTVWTNQRLYLFYLKTLEPSIENGQVKKANNQQDLLYLLKFIYQDGHHLFDPVSFNPVDEVFIPDCINENYTLYGDKYIAPYFVCDDGKFTYLQFSELQERPAIFFVDEYGKEHAINTRQQDDFHVITRLGAQFTLRHGELTTSLFNEEPPEFYL
jgi:type IV secretion system protein VirB9